MDNYKTADVFGVKSKLIASYVERIEVDNKFKEAIIDGNEVIVYGSSKQGKTSLILKHLIEENFVKVECSPQTQTIDIYKSILRQMNITFQESEVKDLSLEHGGKIAANFKVNIPFFADASIGGDVTDKAITKTSSKEVSIEYNLALAQDVSELLKKIDFKKYIVLENFHYLQQDVQEVIYAELSGDFPLGYSRQPTYKSLRPFDLVS